MNLFPNANPAVFDAVFEVISDDSSEGQMWPVFLEWGSSAWYRNVEVKALINNDVMGALTAAGVFLFDPERLTRVFSGVEASKFSDITRAIETRVSSYDDEEDDEEEEADDATT